MNFAQIAERPIASLRPYAGEKLRDALAGMGHWTIEIIKIPWG